MWLLAGWKGVCVCVWGGGGGGRLHSPASIHFILAVCFCGLDAVVCHVQDAIFVATAQVLWYFLHLIQNDLAMRYTRHKDLLNAGSSPERRCRGARSQEVLEEGDYNYIALHCHH